MCAILKKRWNRIGHHWDTGIKKAVTYYIPGVRILVTVYYGRGRRYDDPRVWGWYRNAGAWRREGRWEQGSLQHSSYVQVRDTVPPPDESSRAVHVTWRRTP